jgi:B-box zinc finger
MAKRDELCLNHSDRPATTRCSSCHKPVCDECVVASGGGKFCSQACADRTANFQAHAAGVKGKGGGGKMVKLVVKVVILTVIVLVAYVAYQKFVKGKSNKSIQRGLQRDADKLQDAADDVKKDVKDMAE